jgi:DNA-binding NarL/FixJ family response regulator
MLSASDDPVHVAQAVRAGIKGYVTKSDAPTKLFQAIKDVIAGNRALPEEAVPGASELGADMSEALSPRERSILSLLVAGFNMSEIAVKLGLSNKTITLNCSRLRRRFGARTAVELVSIALRRGLV